MASYQQKTAYNLGSLSPVTKAFMAGSFSGTCSTFIFQPLDLVKTKMQNSTNKATMVQVSKEILRNEGLAGFWKGLKPSLARTVPGVGLYFGCLHGIKTTFKMEKSTLNSALTGASARCIAGMIMMPFTILKIRWEAGMAGSEKRLFQDILNIGRNEGLKGFVKGALPTLARDAPYSGIYLVFYDALKNHMDPIKDQLKISPPVFHMVCGISAGCLASLVTQPADVVKTKMQLNSGIKGSVNSKGGSIRMAATEIWQQQGLGGFTRGLGPRMMRRSLMAAFAWTVYERAMVNMGIKESKNK